MKFTFAILLVAAALQVRGMDRFAALSMIESGDCDRCVGPNGEVSRYQITPGVCRQWGESRDVLTNPVVAHALAVRIMNQRTAQFVAEFHRQPAPAEWYLLWHRPASAVGHRKPTAVEADRAQRFANLVNK